MSLDVKINKNGIFFITNGDVNLYSCYPGIEGRPIKAREVRLCIEEKINKISYYLDEGIINTSITIDNNEILISTELLEFNKMPNWVHVICQAEMNGIEGLFRQGFGIGGPSGYEKIKKYEKSKEKIESYGLIALEGNASYVIMSVDKHDRFINQYDIQFIENDMVNMFVDEKNTKKLLSASFRLEGIYAETLCLPTIKICEVKNLEKGLKDIACKIGEAMKARTHSEPAFYWCSWYYLYYNFTHEHLKKYLEGFTDIKKEIPFKYIQIDAGYFTSCGDWLCENDRFPHGLKVAFDEIKKYDYKPAIWIGPYMVGNRSKLFKDHPEWVLYGIDEKPVTTWKFYSEEHLWGFRDEEYYILDTSHPKAMEYMCGVFRTLKEWGAELFKTDFMLWGIQDSNKVKRHTPGKTSVEYFREFLYKIREVIGEKSYWLGCIAPFLPSIGFADGMRIAGDVGAQWNNSSFGPENMLREVVADNYFNNIYWQNDPDSMLIRNFHTHLTQEEIEALVLMQAMSGGVIYTSDPIHEVSKESLKLLSFVKPEYKVYPCIPFLGQTCKEIVIVNKIKGNHRYVLFILNPTQSDIVNQYKLRDIIGDENYYLRDWKTGECSKDLQTSITVKIPSHGCKLYFLSRVEVLNWNIPNIWQWN